MTRLRPSFDWRRALLATVFLIGACGAATDPSSATDGTAPAPGGAGSDLCQGLVQDRRARPVSALTRPAQGQAVTDPAFGTTVRRVSAASASERENAVIKPAYGTIQAWNADESLLVLWHRGRGHELYDGWSYRFMKSLDISPNDIEQFLWDPVDADLLYYPSGSSLVALHVGGGRNETLFRFPNCERVTLGDDPMYLSWGPDSKVVGLMCREQKFLFDVVGKKIVATASIRGDNAPQPGPSGRLAYLNGSVYDDSLKVVRSFNLANPFEHASLGRSAATGHDVYNAVVFDPPRGASEAAEAGTLVSFDMNTGARKVVIGIATGYPYPPSGTHISSIAHRQPGWVAVSVVGDPKGPEVLHNELLLANVDTGAVCRVAHHRSFAREGHWNYWSEPHVVISPTGTRLLFGSDWGDGPTVDTYVVELPSYSARGAASKTSR